MGVLPLVYNRFDGGMSTDLKIGIPNSFAYSQSVDFRKSPSQLTVLPGLQQEDNEVVVDLIQNEVMIDSGIIYAIGSLGNIYRYFATSSGGLGDWINLGDVGDVCSFGIDYRQDARAIYVCSQKTVSLISLTVMGEDAVINPNFYADSFSTYDNTATVGFNVNSYQIDGVKTTSLSSAINENVRRYFQTDIEPLSKVSVFYTTVPTGTQNLVVHDGLNNIVATATVFAADISANTWVDFVIDTFPSARLYVAPNARTYHIHITSANSDGIITSLATNDFSGINLMIYASRLIYTLNGMHPMTRFLQYECIGNANYLSVWEPLEDPPTNADWQRHRLVFPLEYEVCGLAVQNEFLAIAAGRTTTTATGDPQAGIIFFWDGTSPTYNYDVRIPEGNPQCLHEYKNVLYYYAGGAWYTITGPASQPVKIRTMPGTDTEYSGTDQTITVNPYAATVRRGIHLMGWPSVSTDTNINFGVYSWGAIDKNFPDSFGYSYILSSGTKNYTESNNLQIGMVKAFGDLLHVSWQDANNGTFGVDVINNSSAPATNSIWESRIFDNGFVAREKLGIYTQVTCLELPDDASFVIKYSINRGDWIYSDPFNSTNIEEGIARFDINDGRFYEAQVGIEITSGTTTPTITSINLIFDDCRSESLI